MGVSDIPDKEDFEEKTEEPEKKIKPPRPRKKTSEKTEPEPVLENVPSKEVKQKKPPRPPKKPSPAKVSLEKEIKEELEKLTEMSEEKKKIEVKSIQPVRESREEKPAIETEDDKGKSWFESEGQLAVDVYQTDGEIIIQAAIAGVKPEELDISVENDVVTIKGKRERIFEEEEKNYFYQECYWGRFSREIILPAEVDSSRTTAAMKEGVLTIRIPKIEREKKRKILVKE